MMEGYPVRHFDQPTKRYVQILDIVNDLDLINKYCRCHSQEVFWPEIAAGQRAVGILEMEIYRRDNHLVMIVETVADFDWEKAMAKLATLPRQAEWEAFVAAYQGCDAHAKSDEKWQMTERIFHHYGDK
ncbi:MAG: L-rhamnose mutarotase [Bacteroidales bacterium]|nr:L-rhamnose mutarotase [Bacteroidales bacterium]